MEEQLKAAALEYHATPTPGKISIAPTKGLTNQRDLALAYSPGVAYACKAIEANPAEAARLTSRANLVGVITNGTAVLGLGNIGPLAGKPVMEGKACLFKKFAGIDVFDIELAENDPDKLVDIIAALEPTLGGINLEDIKAPECFHIERRLRDRMKIPVFHDDQHGTAIIVGAAVTNGLKVVGKQIGKVKLVCSGAGASAIACLDLLVRLGLNPDNVLVCDSRGVIYEGREANMEENKARYARKTKARTLADAIPGADIFLGLSGPGAMKQEWVKTMAERPLVLALANPTPEIRPEEVKAVRSDAIIATGRSDYPNQVNNVLCFPFIFRGALDVGATRITDEMKLACVHAIAELAQAEQSDVVAMAYGGQDLTFGPEYIIPTPFDPRLITRIAPAVAKAAMDSGVATRPIADLEAYRQQLTNFVYHSGFVMKPVFDKAKQGPKRVIYAEGEDERVLRAVQAVVDEGLAKPILIGRPEVVDMRLEKFGLRIRPGKDFELVNPESDPRYRDVWTDYFSIMRRRGVTPDDARTHVRQSTTLIGAMLLRRGDGDALLCGTYGRHKDHLRHINNVIGLEKGAGHLCGDERAAAAQADAVRLRHLRQRGSDRRAAGGDRRHGGGGGQAFRHHAEGGAAVPFQLRHRRLALGAEDEPRARADRAARRRPGGGRRDARRFGAVRGDPQPRVSRFALEGAGQPAGDAQPGRGQHLLQPAQDDRRRGLDHRPDPAGCRHAGAHPHAQHDGAAAGEHDGAGGGRCGGGALRHWVRFQSTSQRQGRDAYRLAGPIG